MTPFNFSIVSNPGIYSGPPNSTNLYSSSNQYFSGVVSNIKLKIEPDPLLTILTGGFGQLGNFEPGFLDAEIIIENILPNTIMLPVKGYEDLSDLNVLNRLDTIVSSEIPTPISTGPGLNYSFELVDDVLGNKLYNTHFVIFDNFVDSTDPGGAIHDDMLEWLYEDLYAQTKDHIVIFGGSPFFITRDRDKHLLDDTSKIILNDDNRRKILQIMKEFKVNSYISGGLSTYDSFINDGIWHISTGHSKGLGAGTLLSNSTFLNISSNNDTLTLTSWRDNSRKLNKIIPTGIKYNPKQTLTLTSNYSNNITLQQEYKPNYHYGNQFAYIKFVNTSGITGKTIFIRVDDTVTTMLYGTDYESGASLQEIRNNFIEAVNRHVFLSKVINVSAKSNNIVIIQAKHGYSISNIRTNAASTIIDTTVLTRYQDAYIDENTPTNNYVLNADLPIAGTTDEEKSILLKYDLTNLVDLKEYRTINEFEINAPRDVLIMKAIGAGDTFETITSENNVSISLLPNSPQVGNAFYFGNSRNRFDVLGIRWTTLGVGSWSYVWEYYDGDSWSQFTPTLDETNGFKGASVNQYRKIEFDRPNDWTVTEVNSVKGFWIRLRMSSYTSTTTLPIVDAIRTSKKFTINSAALEIDVSTPSSDIHQVYAIRKNWKVNEVTYMNQNKSTAWEKPGLNSKNDIEVSWEHQRERLFGNDSGSSDLFGRGIDVYNNKALVGAPSNDNGGTADGAVYSFVQNGDFWPEDEKISPPSIENNASFGYDISIDNNSALIGSPLKDFSMISDVGAVYEYEYSSGWNYLNTLLPNDPQAGVLFGTSVSISGDTAVVGAPYDSRDAQYAGTVYVYKRTGSTWNLEARIDPTTAISRTNMLFGWSVALSENTLIVGAPMGFPDGWTPAGTGRAYLFTRNSGIWSQVASGGELIGPGFTASDWYFGWSVAIEQASGYAVVGQHFYNNVTADGRIYVYRRTSAIPPAVQTWTGPTFTGTSATAGTRLGESVAINSTGDRIVAGAPYYSTFSPTTLRRGRIHIYRRGGTTWSNDKIIDFKKVQAVAPIPPNQGNWAITSFIIKNEDLFGLAYPVSNIGDRWTIRVSSVSLGNPTFTIEVQSPYPAAPTFIDTFTPPVLPIGGTASYLVPTTGIQFTITKGSVPLQVNDKFIYQVVGHTVAEDTAGVSVGISGNKIVVGVPNRKTYSGSIPGTGSRKIGNIFLLKDLSSGSWIYNTITEPNLELPGYANLLPGLPPKPPNGSNIGIKVAIQNQYVLIGASQIGNSTGFTYLLEDVSVGQDFSIMIATAKFPPSITGSQNGTTVRFGDAVSIDGSYFIVGALGEDENSAVDQGTASIYFNDTFQQKLAPPASPQPNTLFGWCVRLRGDTAIIGAPGINSNTGRVYIYTKTTSWTLSQRLNADDPATGDRFGYSLDFEDNHLIIGAPYKDTTHADAGKIYCFTKSGGTWSQTVSIQNPNAISSGRFGYSVSIKNNNFVVGAPGNIGTDSITSGCVYVYNITGSLIILDDRIYPHDIINAMLFGSSVSIHSPSNIPHLIVGATLNNATTEEGAVYLFRKLSLDWEQMNSTIFPNHSLSFDQFGTSVKFDRSNGTKLIVGAPGVNESFIYERGFNDVMAYASFDTEKQIINFSSYGISKLNTWLTNPENNFGFVLRGYPSINSTEAIISSSNITNEKKRPKLSLAGTFQDYGITFGDEIYQDNLVNRTKQAFSKRDGSFNYESSPWDVWYYTPDSILKGTNALSSEILTILGTTVGNEVLGSTYLRYKQHDPSIKPLTGCFIEGVESGQIALYITHVDFASQNVIEEDRYKGLMYIVPLFLPETGITSQLAEPLVYEDWIHGEDITSCGIQFQNQSFGKVDGGAYYTSIELKRGMEIVSKVMNLKNEDAKGLTIDINRFTIPSFQGSTGAIWVRGRSTIFTFFADETNIDSDPDRGPLWELYSIENIDELNKKTIEWRYFQIKLAR